MKESPELIGRLEPNEIFVFGSNLSGIHGAGAALFAHTAFGAKKGVGTGMTGDCYAIPTKDFDIKTMDIRLINSFVKCFLDYAKVSSFNFLVTEIGCGLAGYRPEDIAPLFKEVKTHEFLRNVYLPKRFIEIINNNKNGKTKN